MPTATPLETDTLIPKCLIHKKTSTNWTKNPRNCHVMLKLLGDCLIKSTKTTPCVVYHDLLAECQKVSTLHNYPSSPPNI